MDNEMIDSLISKEGMERTQQVNIRSGPIRYPEMPRLDGFALIEKLRSAGDYKHIPIIIVSSRDWEEDKNWSGCGWCLYKSMKISISPTS